jgi:hypothetical protein
MSSENARGGANKEHINIVIINDFNTVVLLFGI